MTYLVYWSFALALIPLVLDLVLGVSTAIGNWLALDRSPLSASDSGIYFNLHSHLSSEAWPPVKPIEVCRHR